MEEKLNCNVVRDLLPNYMEKLTSESTSDSIEKHLESCEECSKIYRQMKEQIPVQAVPETKELKKFLNKTKIMYSMVGVLVLGIIAVLTCFIVDLAVNRCLSWSLIVTGGIIFAYSVGYFLIKGGKNRIIKAFACVSILIIPFLALIQVVTYYYFMDQPGIWLWNIGIPVTMIWLAILWASIFIFKVFHNIYYSITFICFLAIPANYYTNYISGEWNNLREYIDNHFVRNGLGNLLLAVLLLTISICVRINKKKSDRGAAK